MATEVKHAIRTAAAWTADQAAMEAIYGVGNYYTTLSAWEAAQQRDLVTANEIAVAECYNDWSGDGLLDAVHITGWTTGTADVNNPRIIIRTATGQRHAGKAGTGFRMYQSDSWGKTLQVSNNNVHVRGLEAHSTGDSGSGFYSTQNSWSVVFDGCISRAHGGSGESCFFLTREIARNCLALDAAGSRGFGTNSNTWFGYEAFNCVAVGCNQGFGGGNATDRNQGVQLRNCLAYNCSTSFSTANGKWVATSSNNAASNGATVTPPGSSPYTSNVTSADFVDAAGDDFHLASGSGLIGAGANLYSDFTEDIDGDERPSSGAWDVGADRRPSTEVIRTLRASGGDYTLMSTWEAARQRNLSAANEIEVLEVYNDWSSGLPDTVVISGWTTDSTRYVIVRPAAGSGTNGTNDHKGIPGAGFRMVLDASGVVFWVNQNYTRVIGIEVNITADSNGFKYGILCDAQGFWVDRCISRVTYRCFDFDGDSVSVQSRCTNSLALPYGPVKNPTGYFFTATGYSNVLVVNCVAGSGCLNGFDANHTDGVRINRVQNCVSYGHTTNGFTGSFGPESSNNAASSGTPPGASAYGSAVTSADFVNAAGSNYHLSSSSGLIGAGVNLYSLVTHDVDDDERASSGAWDVGFDRYFVVAPTTPTLSNFVATNITATGARVSVDLAF